VVWVRADTTTSVTSSKAAASGATAQRAPRAARSAASSTGPRYRAVHDRVALDEIELYAELIIAAERSEQPLSQQDIDRILGLTVRA
jgi:hypothetical protein